MDKCFPLINIVKKVEKKRIMGGWKMDLNTIPRSFPQVIHKMWIKLCKPYKCGYFLHRQDAVRSPVSACAACVLDIMELCLPVQDLRPFLSDTVS